MKVKQHSCFAFALILLLCILIVWIAWGGGWTLADRLVSSGWELFTLPGCGACTTQLTILDSNMHYGASYVCGLNPPGVREGMCPDAFPTWRNMKTGEVRTGVQDAAALKAMVG